MINLNDVTFRYGRKPPVLRGLSLQLQAGRIYGLLGSNGAGKSSLMRLMAGLLYPTAGQISVNQYEPRRREPAFLEDIFFLPEETDIPPLTLAKYVATFGPFYPKFDAGQFLQYVKAFQLPTTIDKLSDLSLGQRKKVFICFGLATNTRVLLLDEPTNGLDIPSKSQFRKLISATLTDDRLIVISTHQARDLDSLIDSVILLNNQGLLLNAPLERISQRLRFELVGREVPADVLYAEAGLQGHAVVRENTAPEDDTPIDLERLFKAAINNPERIKTLFSAPQP